MKTLIFTTVLIITGFVNIFGQEKCQRTFDEKSQTDILVGACTRDGLLSCAFAEDYNIEYPAYKPNDTVVSQLKPFLTGVKCLIVMGTWCGDSKEQVPRFLKIIDLASTSFEKLDLYCVDRTKEAPGMEIKTTYNIVKVPTFIFYRNDTEIGRIIETPVKTLEKDMLEIISKK